MIAHTIVAAALACGQALALPALQPRQDASAAASSASESVASVASSASSEASSAIASVTSSASAVASSSASSSASAASSAPSASASANPAAGLFSAISARNAPMLASLIENTPQVSQAVVGLLGQTTQNFTLLAPSDSGLSAAVSMIDATNTTLVTELLTYHVLPGYYPAEYFGVNQTSILNTAANQNLVFRRDQYLTTSVVGGQNATVLANSTYQNVLIKLIDNALMLPANVTTTLSGRLAEDTSLLATTVSSIPSLVQTVDTAAAITVFAPNNQALSNIQDTLNSLAGNTDALTQVIAGHVIPGQTLYSNAGPNNIAAGGSQQTAAGTMITFMTNATGSYVESQGTTAQIVRTDVITSNGMSMPGVVHVIDTVLVAASSPSASGSAAAAASSAPSSAASMASSSASAMASSAVSSASSAVEAVASSASSAAPQA